MSVILVDSKPLIIKIQITSYVIKVNYTAWWKHNTEYSQCYTLHCCLCYADVLGSSYHDEVKDGHIYESTDIYIENNV